MRSDIPEFSLLQAAEIAESRYGLRGEPTRIPSERDQNFLCHDRQGARFVLKIANAGDEALLLDGQNKAMDHVARQVEICPKVIPTLDGDHHFTVVGQKDRCHIVRAISFLEGIPLANISSRSDALLLRLGKCVGQLNLALRDFEHPAFHREFNWDLVNAEHVISQHLSRVKNERLRALVERVMADYQATVLPRANRLRKSVIHNDANDGNVIVESGNEHASVVGIIDFGDMVYSYSIADLAVAIAYGVLEQREPLSAAAAIVRGYRRVMRPSDEELACLLSLVRIRLCVSVCMAAYQQSQHPDNEYLSVSQKAIETTLPRLAEIPVEVAEEEFRKVCGLQAGGEDEIALSSQVDAVQHLHARRQRVMGANLSTSYASPLKLVKGRMQYLFDEQGRRYLDAFNNVPHVGHCHPHVVDVAQKQIAQLNTNTRYLHHLQVEYAERLVATMPAPLSVCFLVNSASEANELAIRMARAKTERKDMIVLEGAYHGNTSTLIDLSPYKHNGPGGKGPPAWVHEVAVPDVYRGPFRKEQPDVSKKYAQLVVEKIRSLEESEKRLCGFLAESSPSVAGQIMLPDAYLSEVYDAVRLAGGVCIADEVQTGFGRIGTDFYSFQAQNVVPDIVVLGKPIGNGHPIGAVVTTPEIARAFDRGMEFFSTFGGNTVSCAIGLAVLDVVERESLQENARRVGGILLAELKRLQLECECIGDVRGSGFFIGVELVASKRDMHPAGDLAKRVVDELCHRAILIGSDGPLNNVLKIRPPMQFDDENAKELISNLREVLCAAEDQLATTV